MSTTVGVIGGGAAGLMAAITAAEQGAKVTILERNDQLGKKILVTGNGKCNLTNNKISLTEYYTQNPELLAEFLNQFTCEDAKRFFEHSGLMLKSKGDYVYPYNEQASAVREVLEYRVKQLGITVEYGCWIKRIHFEAESDCFVVYGSKREFRFDKVIITCGGQAAPKTGSDGGGYYLAGQMNHTILPVVPALVQLKCQEKWLAKVAGVRTEAEVRVMQEDKLIASDAGELQLTETGISGIPVFQVSRVANMLLREQEKVSVELSFLPTEEKSDFPEKMFELRKHLMQGRTAQEYFAGLLNSKLMMLFMEFAGIIPTETIADVPEQKIKKVYSYCCSLTVQVIGSNSFDAAQVSAGGIPLTEVNNKLESVFSKGLFFAGEVLDVDGKCGGYNLQWAWCSGYLAGKAAAGK